MEQETRAITPAAIIPQETTLPSVPRDEAAELVGAFLSGRSERTVRAYGQDLQGFASFLGLEDVNEAAGLLLAQGHGKANAVALAYRADMLDRGLAPSTVNRRLASLRSLVKLGRTLGVVPWTLEVPNVKSEKLRDTVGPGRSGVQLLMDALDPRLDSKAKRDRAAVRLLYDLALRRGEVVALDLEDVDLEAGRVAVLRKGKREKNLLSLPEPTKDALREWVAVRGSEPGPLFTNFDRAGKGGRLTGTSLYRIVRDLGLEAGIKVRPHGLRHTGITEAVKAAQRAGISLEEVRDFSGHADVKTLMIYRDRERNVQGQLASLVAGEIA
jgi:integrase/recombinase XerC